MYQCVRASLGLFGSVAPTIVQATAQPSCGGMHLPLDRKPGRARGTCSVCLVLGSGGVGSVGIGAGARPGVTMYLVESGRSSEGRLRLGRSAQPRCVEPRPPRLAALSVLPLEQFAPVLGGGGVLPASAASALEIMMRSNARAGGGLSGGRAA